jgi:hypothetical protein
VPFYDLYVHGLLHSGNILILGLKKTQSSGHMSFQEFRGIFKLSLNKIAVFWDVALCNCKEILAFWRNLMPASSG